MLTGTGAETPLAVRGNPRGDLPIWTSLDLLAAFTAEGRLSREELWADRTALRQYGYVLIPTDQHEIEYHLAKCPVVDGALIENAAAKAFRENLRLAQQRGWLVLMKESPWIFSLLSDLGNALHAQWTDDIADDAARARSNWLLACADLRNWAGCLEGDQTNIARYGQVIAYARLLMNRVDPASKATVERMDAWLEELLGELQTEQPDVHDWLVEHGGLDRRLGRHLHRLCQAAQQAEDASANISPPSGAVAGTTLLREWNGRVHKVIVNSDRDYHYDGQSYRSLSVIARTITGTRWSGPRFFGLPR